MSEMTTQVQTDGCCGADDSCAPDKDVSRDEVRDYYASAAQAQQDNLCCPTSYDPTHVDHIPEAVLEVSYGCGSPMGSAQPGAGDRVLDLGSGGGIDCFIAAKLVGEKGSVIGVDMTDEMLARATGAADQVAERLGYANVEFRKGFLEQLPVDDGQIDLVTSNCVLNLSTDKAKTFAEIHRVLTHRGRFVISDIVSNQPVPEQMQQDKELWGECISGAMTEQDFVDAAAAAGFYGMTLEREYLWKEVGGLKFYSTVFRGWRFDKSAECDYQGQTAVYLGPGSRFTDDDGHTYARGEIVQVCTDTATKLSAAPYCGMFEVAAAEETPATSSCC